MVQLREANLYNGQPMEIQSVFVNSQDKASSVSNILEFALWITMTARQDRTAAAKA